MIDNELLSLILSGVSILLFILFSTGPAKFDRLRLLTQTEDQKDAQLRFGIHKITRTIRKDRKRQWRFWKRLMTAMGIILIGLFCALIFLLTKGGKTIEMDARLMLLSVLMVAPAIGLLVSAFKTERHFKKTGQSWVAAKAKIEIEVDFSRLFYQCQKVLSDMGAIINTVDRSRKYIEAQLGTDLISISISSRSNSCQIVAIVSDSKLPSVLWDFGRNRRNVKEVIRRLMY